jgi:hypothetical protein
MLLALSRRAAPLVVAGMSAKAANFQMVQIRPDPEIDVYV